MDKKNYEQYEVSSPTTAPEIKDMSMQVCAIPTSKVRIETILLCDYLKVLVMFNTVYSCCNLETRDLYLLPYKCIETILFCGDVKVFVK